MPTNKKPMLSVLVDKEKRNHFTQLCARNARSMSWVINSFITHCIEQDSIELWLEYPSVIADSEGLSELRDMMIELGRSLKQMEANTLYINIGESQVVEPLPTAVENSQCLKKQQIIAEMAERMGWKLRDYT